MTFSYYNRQTPFLYYKLGEIRPLGNSPAPACHFSGSGKRPRASRDAAGPGRVPLHMCPQHAPRHQASRPFGAARRRLA